MKAFRDRSADIEKMKGKVVAISADDTDTLKSWRDELKAPQTFVSDYDLNIIRLYDVKMTLVGVAQRHTFVIGPGRKVLSHVSGSDAINPDGAIAACPLHGHDAPKTEPATLQVKDGGQPAK